MAIDFTPYLIADGEFHVLQMRWERGVLWVRVDAGKWQRTTHPKGATEK